MSAPPCASATGPVPRWRRQAGVAAPRSRPRPAGCGSGRDRPPKSNSNGGKSPGSAANCTYFVVPTTRHRERAVKEGDRELLDQAVDGSEKSHSKCAVSRQWSGDPLPRRNGASDHPSACRGTSTPIHSQMVGEHVDRLGEIVDDGAAAAFGLRTGSPRSAARDSSRPNSPASPRASGRRPVRRGRSSR